jgi:hypothetical protein
MKMVGSVQIPGSIHGDFAAGGLMSEQRKSKFPTIPKKSASFAVQ